MTSRARSGYDSRSEKRRGSSTSNGDIGVSNGIKRGKGKGKGNTGSLKRTSRSRKRWSEVFEPPREEIESRTAENVEGITNSAQGQGGKDVMDFPLSSEDSDSEREGSMLKVDDDIPPPPPPFSSEAEVVEGSSTSSPFQSWLGDPASRLTCTTDRSGNQRCFVFTSPLASDSPLVPIDEGNDDDDRDRAQDSSTAIMNNSPFSTNSRPHHHGGFGNLNPPSESPSGGSSSSASLSLLLPLLILLSTLLSLLLLFLLFLLLLRRHRRLLASTGPPDSQRIEAGGGGNDQGSIWNSWSSLGWGSLGLGSRRGRISLRGSEDGPVDVAREEELLEERSGDGEGGMLEGVENRWLEGVSERERQAYRRAKLFQQQYPPNSFPTDITLSQFLSIQEKGVSAWCFEPDYESNPPIIVQSRTEISFLESTAGTDEEYPCSVQTNLPLPRMNEVYYWECKLYEVGQGVNVALGLATRPYPSFRLPGWNRYSVGYFSLDGFKSHSYPFFSTSYGPSLTSGDVLGIGYRPRSGSVFFTRNGKRLEDAYVGLNKSNTLNLFPTVGSDGPARVEVNLGQSGFVFIEANVKKWGLAPSMGTLAPPPAYGSERGSILLETGRGAGSESASRTDDDLPPRENERQWGRNGSRRSSNRSTNGRNSGNGHRHTESMPNFPTSAGGYFSVPVGAPAQPSPSGSSNFPMPPPSPGPPPPIGRSILNPNAPHKPSPLRTSSLARQSPSPSAVSDSSRLSLISSVSGNGSRSRSGSGSVIEEEISGEEVPMEGTSGGSRPRSSRNTNGNANAELQADEEASESGSSSDHGTPPTPGRTDVMLQELNSRDAAGAAAAAAAANGGSSNVPPPEYRVLDPYKYAPGVGESMLEEILATQGRAALAGIPIASGSGSHYHQAGSPPMGISYEARHPLAHQAAISPGDLTSPTSPTDGHESPGGESESSNSWFSWFRRGMNQTQDGEHQDSSSSPNDAERQV